MNYKFSCNECGQHIEVGIEQAGMNGYCPSCGIEIVVPEPIPPYPSDLPPTNMAAESTQQAPKNAGSFFQMLFNCLRSGVGVWVFLVLLSLVSTLTDHSREKKPAVMHSSVPSTKIDSNPPPQISSNPPPQIDVKGQATLVYMRALHEILGTVQFNLPKDAPATDRELEQIATTLESTASRLNEAKSKIRGIETRGVDSEAVSVGLQWGDWLGSATEHTLNHAQMASNVTKFRRNHTSNSAMAESFLRGLAGDNPLNKFYEGKEDERKLIEMFERLGGEKQQLQRDFNQLESMQARLLVKLKERYPGSF